VAAYLSPAWLTALQEAADASPTLHDATTGVHLVVQQVITGGADGDVAYHVVVDDGRMTVRPGHAEDPTVTFTQDRATAEAVTRGDQSAQGAFMAGHMRIRGDLRALVAQQDTLLHVDDVFASVRETTSY
jgi:alkyl sulfatase BDS1-like metallo-beta-lactamase superfamily hydrolase